MPSNIDILVKATDQATSVLSAVQKQNEALARSNDANTGALTRLNAVLSEHKLLYSGLVAAIAAVPATLAVLAHQAVDTGDRLNELAQQVGVSVEFLSSLRITARQNGVDLASLAFGFKQLASQVQDTADPASAATIAFRRLGVEVHDSEGKLKSSEEIFRAVADGFTSLQDGAGKSVLAVQLFGRAGQNLIPLLNGGSASIDAMQGKVRALGLEFSGNAARAAGQFNDSLNDLKTVFEGAAQKLAVQVLPALNKFLEFAVAHGPTIQKAFVIIAETVAGLGVVFTAVKFAGFADALLTALVGPAALAQLTYKNAFALIAEGAANLALRFGLLKTAVGGAMALGPLGLAVVAIGALAAAIGIASSAWSAYKARQQEALSEQNLKDANTNLRAFTERQIAEFERAGKITKEAADQMRADIERAFTPRTVTTTIPPRLTERGFVQEQTVTRTIPPDAGVGNDVMREKLRLLRGVEESLQRQGQQSQANQLTDKARAAEEAAAFAIFKAKRELELAELEAAFNQAGSTISAAELEQRSRAILSDVFEKQLTFINSEADRQIASIRAKVQNDPTFQALPKDKQPAELERSTRSEITEINAKRDADLIQAQVEFDQKILAGAQKRSESEIADAKTAAQNRITLAQLTNQELLAGELQLEQQLAELRASQKNLPADLRLTEAEIENARVAALTRLRVQQEQKDKQALIEIDLALVEAERARLNSDPSPNIAAKHERLVALVSRHNDLLLRQIEINRAALASGTLSLQEQAAAQQKILQLETQIIENRRQANLQDAFDKKFSATSGALGRQNVLDEQGNATGAREFAQPLKALDDFGANTLNTTFRGLSDSLSSIILQTGQWGQIWRQVQSSIIAGVVDLILQYTLFNTIRTTLDNIFHLGARQNITATKAVGSAAQKASAAESAATASTTASAWSPAALFSSIGSFGVAGVVGLAAVLAGIAALAGAFAEGGYVRGPGGPKEDKIPAWLSNGEGVINAAATARYGGRAFIDAVNAQQLETFVAAFASGGLVSEALHFKPAAVDFAHVTIPRLAEGGFIGTDARLAVVAGDTLEARGAFQNHVNVTAEPQVVIVDNIQRALEVLKGRDGRAVILGHVRGAKTELGIPS